MENSDTKVANGIQVIDPLEDEEWPAETPEGIRRYLTHLAERKPESFVLNAAGVDAIVLRVGEAVLPVLVSDGAAAKASILSPFGHHLSYPIEEISRRSKYLQPWMLRVSLLPLSLLLRSGKVDKIVLVNHWLLSGAPKPDVARSDWREVVHFLSLKYPQHAIVLQDIKPEVAPDNASSVTDAGACLIPTRLVHIVDPKRPLVGKECKKIRYERNRSRKIYADNLKNLIQSDMLDDATRQMRELYVKSNIARHSTLNPDYTEAFFELALKCEEFRFHAWHGPDKSKITGFNLQRSDSEYVHWSTFGLDADAVTDGTHNQGLYHLIIAADLHESEQNGLMLDWGAGAKEFKQFRGALEYVQYEAVFFQHLSYWRRFVWRSLAWLRNLRLRQLKA